MLKRAKTIMARDFATHRLVPIRNASQLPSLEAFGVLVRDARKRLRLNQVEVAELLGISRNYLSQIENGRAKSLSYSMARQIIESLEISIESQ